MRKTFYSHLIQKVPVQRKSAEIARKKYKEKDREQEK